MSHFSFSIMASPNSQHLIQDSLPPFTPWPPTSTSSSTAGVCSPPLSVLPHLTCLTLIGSKSPSPLSTCVLLSLLLSFLLLHRLEGFGVATIASALFVGRCVNLIRKLLTLRASAHHHKERAEHIHQKC